LSKVINGIEEEMKFPKIRATINKNEDEKGRRRIEGVVKR